MQILKASELEQIEGGGSLWKIVVGIAAGIGAFFAGFIDGYTNPTACRR